MKKTLIALTTCVILLSCNVKAGDRYYYDDNITLDVASGCIAACLANGKVVADETINTAIDSISDGKENFSASCVNTEDLIKSHMDLFELFFEGHKNTEALIKNCKLIIDRIVLKAQETNHLNVVETILNKVEEKLF